MEKQVNSDHYRFGRYMELPRWNSLWYQIDTIEALKPQSILEIGPGPGFLQAICGKMGLVVETVDLDPELQPDHVASVTDLPLPSKSYDLVCAFQVLEHLPFDVALSALNEMARVARHHVVLSLPDSRRTWRFLIHLPKLGERRLIVPRPQCSPPAHIFDGEHYWEINKQGYKLKNVIAAFQASGMLNLVKTFQTFENPYHRFFVFAVASPKEDGQ